LNFSPKNHRLEKCDHLRDIVAADRPLYANQRRQRSKRNRLHWAPYDFDDNFLNLIVTQSATNSTFLDDSILAATNFVPIGMTGYYGAQISVTSGTHIITFTMSDGYRDSTNAATVTLTTGDPNLSANYQTAMTGTNQSGQYIFQFRNGVPLQTP